ncbi:helix-turn-helix transcriptional regulator [Allobranchiibius sp. CTAmp26]|uniref:ArsR/SmtB family transcription factor n=1 Tax=Allobranchiibius sp. CTAmp26 TaxID=2815214 RepID=UPI001AA1155B|nr:helix-turn-helix domain-containing protein [Allobranchiibius sp. CTAmp26]MBO1755416.1 helix-turn-helix transcriptional regulator [Allobranchiibius sp. CTAmp26]
MPTPSPRAKSLRTLAHPLRSRLLGQLRVHGPATASDLARTLGTNTGATSYHLRRLEESGLVADDGSGTGRRRVWVAQVVEQADEGPATPDEHAAELWLQRDYVEYFATRADRWATERQEWPQGWQQNCGLEDHPVLVTTEQLSALAAELSEVFERYRRVGAGSPGARRVTAYTALLPVDGPSGQTPATR